MKTNMIARGVLAILLLALAGCGESGQIKRVIRDSLVDPDSVKFRGDVVHSEDGNRACILVNAKNKMGGYTGFTPVVVDKNNGKWVDPMSMDIYDCEFWIKRLSEK